MSEIEDHKQRVVRCIRMLERSGTMDYNGHASTRIGDNRMLINIGSCQRSRLTVDDICTAGATMWTTMERHLGILVVQV